MRITEIDNKLFEKCWKGYEKKGMKKMFGKTVPNCVKKESVLDEDYIISLKGKEVSRHKEENEARSAWHKLRKQHGNDVTIKKESVLDEDLRAWFGKGKKGGAGGGGWDRYNTKGERIGKCGDSKPGEGKPKCLSKARAASLRSSGGKKAIANAVKRKRKNDPNKNRRGKAKNVNNHPKK